MRAFFKTVKFWITDTFASRGRSVPQDNTLGRTIRDASHVRGGDLSRSAGEEVLDIAVEGAENYGKSFKKDS